MNNYQFLKQYILSLSDLKREQFTLNKGIGKEEIRMLQKKVNVDIPGELEEFYEFSYGAMLDEYKVLRIPEIAETMSSMKMIYADTYKTTIIPFASLIGVGDFIAFNTEKRNDEDSLLIIDCFHELPPDEWNGICFGLRNWLKDMVNNDFRPYWI